eukprot:Gb_07161 [translate_table: standard]
MESDITSWEGLEMALLTCTMNWYSLSRSDGFSSLGSRMEIPKAAKLKNELPRGSGSRSRTLRRVTAEHTEMFVTGEEATPNISSLKTELLSVVAGLDRGLVANEADVMAANSSAKKLEVSGGIVDFSAGLDKLQGRWRLIYSSAFASGSLGGSRPGPPTGRLLLTLGQVFQRIDIVGREFDNIVDLNIGTPWPLPLIEVTATLAHRFELIGAAKVRIIFERTIVRPAGGLSQLPPIELPQLPEILRPPSSLRSGDFEVTFVDDDLRITRGDREELRVFIKA